MMSDIAPLERRADLAPENAVFVRLPLGLEARMEIERSFLHPRNANVAGQQAVRRSLQIHNWNRILHRQRRYLRQGVNTGIRPARPGHLHSAAFDLAEDLLQSSLDCR